MAKYDYDLAVIGGGSGGMAAANEASKLGAKTVLFDFVKPTQHGTKWGIGGTCVNVGCIPKKLMHYASLMSPILHNDAKVLGWKYSMNSPTIEWNTLVETVQTTVKKLNFIYRGGLRKNNVTYINAYAKFCDCHTLKYQDSGEEKSLTANKIIIAVGGRPHIPEDIPNARELAITSDDVFTLPKAPGKTLVVGAAYIALETAGFLTELGFATTVAVRSVPLRTFDQQCAAKIVEMMESMGTRFLHHALVKSMKKLPSGEILVSFHGDSFPDEAFDTVLYASGRRPDTASLNLSKIGVHLGGDGKIIAPQEQTNVDNIFAVGDCVAERLELTPVAIKAAELLVHRLFTDKDDEHMDYDYIPTTIFTPMEYGCVGLSEEDAVARYGEGNIEIYLQEHKTLEISAVHRPKVESMRQDEFDTEIGETCLVKLVCLKSDRERVIGFHFVGPNAGEMTQGFALALRLGATKADFSKMTGIHPTDVEAFANLVVTKASGQPYSLSSCGGGKCG